MEEAQTASRLRHMLHCLLRAKHSSQDFAMRYRHCYRGNCHLLEVVI